LYWASLGEEAHETLGAPLYWARVPWAPRPNCLGLGFLGEGWPALALASVALGPSLGRRPWWLGEGVRCTALRLYKGGLGEERTHKFHEPLLPLSVTHHLHLAAGLLHPLSPTWPPKGCAGGRSHHRCTPLCCGVSGSLSNAIYFRNIGWNGDSGSHHDHRTCARMRRCRSCGVGVIAPRSSRP
jgi:hypothetical protein